MIGNDVVDLTLAQSESNWRRPNFLKKIFTEKEQAFISVSDNPDLEVWKLWSRKEAVYKIVNRAEGIRKFNPLSFKCYFDHLHSIEVRYKNKLFFTRTEISLDYVHTIAVQDGDDFNKFIFLDKSEIIKENSLPFYRSKNNQINMASVSHHGRFYFAVGLKS